VRQLVGEGYTVAALARRGEELEKLATAAEREGRESGGRVLTRTIVIPDGRSLFGRVRLADQSPASSAHIWHEDPDAALETGGNFTVETYADSAGYFELGGLGPGAHHIFACAANDRGLFSSTVVTIGDDEEAVWEPTLVPITPLRLRVVNQAGTPVSGGYAMLHYNGLPPWTTGRRGDEGGRSVILQTPTGSMDLWVSLDTRAVGVTTLRNVTWSADEMVVQVSPQPQVGSVRGVLSDEAGTRLPHASVVLADGRFRIFDTLADPGTGRFRLREIPVGTYRFAVRIPMLGQHVLTDQEFEDGDAIDLGEVRIPVPSRIEMPVA